MVGAEDGAPAHGYPILPAETFVDPARFAGTCYRASNWRSPGLTRGDARDPEARRIERRRRPLLCRTGR